MDNRDQVPAPVGQLKPLGASLKMLPTSTGKPSFVGTGSKEIDPAVRAWIATRVGLLLGSYRYDDAPDPETYAAAAIRILATYPPEVIVAVTDPETGVQTMEFEDERTGRKFRLKSAPQPPYLKEACEKLYAPIRRAAEREEGNRRRARQLAEEQALIAARIGPEEQERRAAQVAAALGARARSTLEVLVDQAVALGHGNGAPGHALRVAMDLAERRERAESHG